MKNESDAEIEIYNLENDIGEENNLAAENPDIVDRISNIMENAHSYSDEFLFGFEKVEID